MYTLSNGTQIEPIGFGTYKVTEDFTGGMTEQIVLEALEVGYRYIDTAAFYGNEEEIGRALARTGVPREEIFVATKVWKTNLGYEKTKVSIEESLKRLQLDYIDLLLIHWPKESPDDTDWKAKVQGSYRAMEEAYREGKVRNLGLSNFLPYHIMGLMETATVKPVLDQLELHVGHMQQAAVDYCRKENIQVQAWSPLGRERIFRFPALIEMAAKYGVTVPDLLLRFLLQQGISIIPKATTREHMEANLHPAEFTICESDFYFLLCMPTLGWGGEHPDFERAAIDTRYA